MRIFFVLSCFIMFLPQLQGQKLSAKFSGQSLTAALNTLSDKYNLKIAFDNQVADKAIVYTNISKVSVEEALHAVTAGTGLVVQRMGDVYMIIPEPKNDPAEEFKLTDIKITDKPASFFVSGIVKDKMSGETLPFASVFISKNHLGTTTNADGFFQVRINSDDTVYFVVNCIGYAPIACKAIPQAKPVTQTISMEPRIEQLNTVVVYDKVEVFDNEGTNVEKIKFSPSKMGNIPSLAELDIIAPLQMLPGINATSENAGGFSIRKSPADKTLMVYDGFTMYHMNHFFGAFSSVNTKAVKDIEVYKSGFGARYGGSVGGIVEITGKSGNMQKAVVDIGADMLAVDAKVEIPIVKEKCSFLFSGRRSFTDKFRTPLYNTMFENVRYDFTSYYRTPPVAFTSKAEDPLYYYGDLNSKITLRLSKVSMLSLSVFGSSDKLGFSQTVVYPKLWEDTRWGTKGASARWVGKISSRWNAEFVLGSSKTTFDYLFSDSILKVRKRLLGQVTNTITKSSGINSFLKNSSVTWNNTIEIFEGQKLETGLSLQVLNSLYNYNAQTTLNGTSLLDTSRIYEKEAQLHSFWFQYQLFGEQWSVIPGIRFSKYSVTNRSYPEFRLSGLYKMMPSVTFKANVGKYYQFINKVNVTKKGDYRSVWVISDDEKSPVVSAWSISGGINFAITPSVNLDIETYYKETENLVTSVEEYRLREADVKLRSVSWLYDTKVKGLDVLLKQIYGNYQLWTSYTLSKSISIKEKIKNVLEYPSDNDQLHELKLLHLFKWKNLMFSFSNIYGSGTVWDEYILDKNFTLSKDYQKNGGQVPEYIRFDAGINYTLRRGGSEVKIGCNIFNLFNHKNVVQRFQKLSETPYQDIAQGINPLEETSVYGLGFSSNFFLNISF